MISAFLVALLLAIAGWALAIRGLSLRRSLRKDLDEAEVLIRGLKAANDEFAKRLMSLSTGTPGDRARAATAIVSGPAPGPKAAPQGRG